MKKIWKIRKDSEAVSPVIATILMVAITVVLAAVLYVMVMGFGGPSNQTPTGAFTSATKVDAKSVKFLFGAISPETKFIDCKLIVENPAGDSVTTNWATATVANTTLIAPLANHYLLGADLSADGKISVGDYVTIRGGAALATGTWTVTLIHTPSGGTIASKIVVV